MNRIFCILLSMIIIFNSFSFAISTSEYELEVFDDEDFKDSLPASSVNTKADGTVNLDLTSKSVILMEPLTGKVIYEKNCHEKLEPASVTKIMALLLFMEAIDSGRIKLEDMVTCSTYASSMGGSQVFLKENERMSVHELLKCVVVSSGNDATVALGEYVAGSNELFVSKMNEKAKKLGMNDTYFMNATGLNSEGHLTSAYDIAIMSKELITKHPTIFNYTTIWMDTIRDGEFGLANTNKMIRFYNGADGLKTGSTSTAGFCLSATAEREGLRFIAVIMKAETSKIRFSEASKLLDYGFANYKSEVIAKADEEYGDVKVSKGMSPTVKAGVLEDMRVIINKADMNNLREHVILDEKVAAPVLKGTKIGEMQVKNGDKIVATINLVAKENVGKMLYINIYYKMCQRLIGTN